MADDTIDTSGVTPQQVPRARDLGPRASAEELKQLRADLTRVLPGNDPQALNDLAKQALVDKEIPPDEFAQQLNGTSYKISDGLNQQRWDHKKSIKILHRGIASTTDPEKKERLDQRLTIAEDLDRARDHQISTEQADRAEVVTRSAVPDIEESERVMAHAPAAEETIENRGAVTESRIQTRPEELDARFTIQTKGGSERYYHKDSQEEAFRDTGKKIIVKPESRKLVAADVAKLADAKGWTDVKVTGNANFRRDVWKEANLRGIEVVGYIPTEQDKRDLDKRLASIEAAPRDNQSEKENQKIAPKVAVGTVGDSKSANPEVNEAAEKRAQLASAYANDSREDAVSKHPELKELYGLEKAAQQFAGSSIESPRSQEQFVATVRDRGLDELSKGNKLPELKVAPIQPQPERGAGLGR